MMALEVEREGDEVMDVVAMAGPWLVSTAQMYGHVVCTILYPSNNKFHASFVVAQLVECSRNM